MSGSVNDELIQPSSDSFWEIDSYKRTTKRQDDGNRLCLDLINLVQERADLEKAHAKELKKWSKKWNDTITKGPEYGTTQGAWQGVLTEAMRVAELHMGIRDKLLNDVQTQIKQWKSENYHKSVMSQCKETKDLEDAFRKVQKPWAKRYVKVMKCKKDYHMACKGAKSSELQENNAKADSSVSQDQLKKIADKAEKFRREVDSTKDKYEAALSDINGYNGRYIEDMTEVFNKSQELEEKRLKFVKEMLFGIHKCLDLSVCDEFPQIYKELYATIQNADYSKDLKWWSQFHGVDMPMNWPHFEDYSPELHSISRKDKKGTVSSHGEGITLTAHYQKTADTYVPPAPTYTENNPQSYDNPASTAITTTTSNVNTNTIQSNGGQNQNPFGEDDWEDYDNALIDDGSPGVPVRALYDYDGAEEDELTFKTGDVFEKLRDRDDQGWCKGRLNGHVGLFPDNYVEIIQ